ncbi:hypothetical protein E4T56_gene3144 [Termitomyces sp. T112]|nr:hypothetical protein E4T56_gene3144 [Termitomyces sp. T112]
MAYGKDPKSTQSEGVSFQGTEQDTDYNSPTIQPPPLNPDNYVPHTTPDIDFTHLAGNFDPTAIPLMEQDHVLGTAAHASVLTPEFAAILAQLTHIQSILQNSLIDVMNKVARRPGHHVSDQNTVAHGSHVKLSYARIFSGKHGDVTPFLFEGKRIIQFHTISFPVGHTKVLYVGRHLKDGMPIDLFNHLERANLTHSYSMTGIVFSGIFQVSYPTLVQNAELKLEALKQIGSTHYYLMAFMQLARHFDMTEQNKITRFMKGFKS